MATATMNATAATSASAPEIHTRHTLPAPSILPSVSLDAQLMSSPRVASSGPPTQASSPNSADLASASSDASSEPDPQILEALRSKDRLYILKLGEQMESMISDRRPRLDLTPATSYQRMLVHRCSAYYKLIPERDDATKSITVLYCAESRIPSRRIRELVPLEESAQPAFKIMRRGTQDSAKTRVASQTGSVAGDDDSSDVDPSETGSIGGRSNATGTAAKKYKTLEEREAEYNEARSRIFMDFDEKDKEKDKHMSANSSTLSVNSSSASASTSGTRCSSIGDLDDSASSAATESEWSGPVTRDKRDNRRGGSAGSSSRSIRSSGASYNPTGSGSSRDSRATSPSFTYPSMYDPQAVEGMAYGAPPHGYMTHYVYPYAHAPGQPTPPYAYPYYMPYGYPPVHMADPASGGLPDQMYAPPQGTPPQMTYMNGYMWPQPQSGQPVLPPQSNPTSPGSGGANLPQQQHPSSPQPPNAPPLPYHHYMPPGQYNPYAMPGYPPPPGTYPPPGQFAPPQMPGQQLYTPDAGAGGYMNGNGGDGTNNGRSLSRNGHNNKRGSQRARGAWYPPSGRGSEYTYNHNYGSGPGGNDAVGPRLNTNFRRISSGSGSTGARTPGDEASSTASSSTSSSSRQTYTSTSTSSKHPLPARPDWAVGMKAQPGLYVPRHHDHGNANSRTMSPARLGGQAHLAPQHQPPILHSNDFPPLSSGGPERRLPAVGGAWTNPSSMRSIMTPGPQGSNTQGTALVHYPNAQHPAGQNTNVGPPLTDDQEVGFERPPPKGPAELFNPKSNTRGSTTSRGDRSSKAGQAETQDVSNEQAQVTEDVTDAALAEKVGILTVDEHVAGEDEASASAARPPSAIPPPSVEADGGLDEGDS
ncbi:hypothetical protein WOLCODRAFT_140262 [Wolfiporia cocos MD-104 SS10]|uniref:SUZ domain-containing protein n=1 Tax=Wolfiporia cocos (strain MD-104) TaxID=742152 RepID=A0A2H3JBV8_WOLCO|nr:hypothetical protein WOLCODRAFT_140262 [Wolfiporia cocos MD-104 SS10]